MTGARQAGAGPANAYTREAADASAADSSVERRALLLLLGITLLGLVLRFWHLGRMEFPGDRDIHLPGLAEPAVRQRPPAGLPAELLPGPAVPSAGRAGPAPDPGPGRHARHSGDVFLRPAAGRLARGAVRGAARDVESDPDPVFPAGPILVAGLPLHHHRADRGLPGGAGAERPPVRPGDRHHDPGRPLPPGGSGGPGWPRAPPAVRRQPGAAGAVVGAHRRQDRGHGGRWSWSPWRCIGSFPCSAAGSGSTTECRATGSSCCGRRPRRASSR